MVLRENEKYLFGAETFQRGQQILGVLLKWDDLELKIKQKVLCGLVIHYSLAVTKENLWLK